MWSLQGWGEGTEALGLLGVSRMFPKPDLLGSGLVGANYMVHVFGLSVMSDSLQPHGL